MAKRKTATATTTKELDAAKAEAETISGLTLKDKIQLLVDITKNPDTKDRDKLDALKMLLEIEGAQIEQDETIHVFLDPEFAEEYQAKYGLKEIQAPTFEINLPRKITDKLEIEQN